MCGSVKDRFVFESFPFIIGNNEECKFDCRMETIGLFNEQVNFLFDGVPWRKHVVNISILHCSQKLNSQMINT